MLLEGLVAASTIFYSGFTELYEHDLLEHGRIGQ